MCVLPISLSFLENTSANIVNGPGTNSHSSSVRFSQLLVNKSFKWSGTVWWISAFLPCKLVAAWDGLGLFSSDKVWLDLACRFGLSSKLSAIIGSPWPMTVFGLTDTGLFERLRSLRGTLPLVTSTNVPGISTSLSPWILDILLLTMSHVNSLFLACSLWQAFHFLMVSGRPFPVQP